MTVLIDMIPGSFREGLMITVFVFVMMMIIDYFSVLSRGVFDRLVRGKGRLQYFIAAFLGVTPGCLGAFINVSFYMRGLLTFGAVAAGMIATSGDEAFVMLSLFPDKALILFGVQFAVAVGAGFVIDAVVKKCRIKTCRECAVSAPHDSADCRVLGVREIWSQIKSMSLTRFLLLGFILAAIISLTTGFIGPGTWDWKRITFLSLMALALFIVLTVPDHYLHAHIWEHIFKKHLWRIFLWSFGVILVMTVGLHYLDVESFIKAHLVWVLLIAGLVGLIPESGPHMIFVMLFSRGLIPFSVLLASSIVQDGHGMLPLLSYSVRDSILMKLFNLAIGLALGFGLFLLGV